MNLYLIKRTPDYFVSDAYACAIVAAKDGQAAKHTHPVRGVIWRGESWCKGGKTMVSRPGPSRETSDHDSSVRLSGV
jgi:hypothetical protein